MNVADGQSRDAFHLQEIFLLAVGLLGSNEAACSLFKKVDFFGRESMCVRVFRSLGESDALAVLYFRRRLLLMVVARKHNAVAAPCEEQPRHKDET